MEIFIREIDENDYPALLTLWQNELGSKYVTAENIAPHYERVKDDERYKTYVACTEGAVIGFISSVQSYGVGCDGENLQIIAMAVKEEYQNKGVGKKLIQRLEDYARENNFFSIGVCSGFKRTAAHIFYEHSGFEKGSYAFSKIL